MSRKQISFAGEDDNAYRIPIEILNDLGCETLVIDVSSEIADTSQERDISWEKGSTHTLIDLLPLVIKELETNGKLNILEKCDTYTDFIE